MQFYIVSLSVLILKIAFSSTYFAFATPPPPAIGKILLTTLPKVPGIAKAFIPTKIKANKRIIIDIKIANDQINISLDIPRLSMLNKILYSIIYPMDFSNSELFKVIFSP